MWSFGTYRSSWVNVMTLTWITHRQCSICIFSILFQSYLLVFTICHLSPLPGLSLSLQTSCTLRYVCVIDSDLRFICICERMRQSKETDTSAVGKVLLSELTSHPHRGLILYYSNALLPYPLRQSAFTINTVYHCI